MPQKSIRQALNEALAQEMRRDPTVGGSTAGDILADHDDGRVAAHFLRERLIERLADRFLRHGGLPQYDA